MNSLEVLLKTKMRRIPIESLADGQHGRIALEGENTERLPKDRVYIDPKTGRIVDGGKGGKMGDLKGGMAELPKTTWWNMDIGRLEIEAREMLRVFERKYELYEDKGEYFWKGRTPSSHTIRAVYAPNHPFQPMKVFATPDVDTHHKYEDGSLCLWKSAEWSPNMTAATVIGIATWFLKECKKGS